MNLENTSRILAECVENILLLPLVHKLYPFKVVQGDGIVKCFGILSTILSRSALHVPRAHFFPFKSLQLYVPFKGIVISPVLTKSSEPVVGVR